MTNRRGEKEKYKEKRGIGRDGRKDREDRIAV